MKKLFIFILLLSGVLFAYQGAQHKIVDIESNGKVIRVNIGKQANVQVGDVFQVFGKSQIIHPATGELVERDNIYIGKVEITKVLPTESLAKIVEQNKYFDIGDKITKVSKNADLIELQEFTENEFESPSKRDYNETIYSKKTEKRNPERSIVAKKLWIDGPFTLGEGEFLFDLGVNDEYMTLSDDDAYNNWYYATVTTSFTCHYGIRDDFQIGFELPLTMHIRNYRYNNGSDKGYTSTGLGLSDIMLSALYSSILPNNKSINYSGGFILSIPTDAGVDELDGDGEYKLATSKGYLVYTLLGSIGKKFDNKYFYAEYLYHINGKRKEHSYEYNGTKYTVSEFNPTNNSDLNFVGSFFTSQKSRFKLKLSCQFNKTPIDKDSSSDKKNIIAFMPSYSHAREKIIWELGVDFPLKNDYDTKYVRVFYNLIW